MQRTAANVPVLTWDAPSLKPGFPPQFFRNVTPTEASQLQQQLPPMGFSIIPSAAETGQGGFQLLFPPSLMTQRQPVPLPTATMPSPFQPSYISTQPSAPPSGLLESLQPPVPQLPSTVPVTFPTEIPPPLAPATPQQVFTTGVVTPVVVPFGTGSMGTISEPENRDDLQNLPSIPTLTEELCPGKPLLITTIQAAEENQIIVASLLGDIVERYNEYEALNSELSNVLGECRSKEDPNKKNSAADVLERKWWNDINKTLQTINNLMQPEIFLQNEFDIRSWLNRVEDDLEGAWMDVQQLCPGTAGSPFLNRQEDAVQTTVQTLNTPLELANWFNDTTNTNFDKKIIRVSKSEGAILLPIKGSESKEFPKEWKWNEWIVKDAVQVSPKDSFIEKWLLAANLDPKKERPSSDINNPIINISFRYLSTVFDVLHARMRALVKAFDRVPADQWAQAWTSCRSWMTGRFASGSPQQLAADTLFNENIQWNDFVFNKSTVLQALQVMDSYYDDVQAETVVIGLYTTKSLPTAKRTFANSRSISSRKETLQANLPVRIATSARELFLGFYNKAASVLGYLASVGYFPSVLRWIYSNKYSLILLVVFALVIFGYVTGINIPIEVTRWFGGAGVVWDYIASIMNRIREVACGSVGTTLVSTASLGVYLNFLFNYRKGQGVPVSNLAQTIATTLATILSWFCTILPTPTVSPTGPSASPQPVTTGGAPPPPSPPGQPTAAPTVALPITSQAGIPAAGETLPFQPPPPVGGALGIRLPEPTIENRLIVYQQASPDITPPANVSPLREPLPGEPLQNFYVVPTRSQASIPQSEIDATLKEMTGLDPGTNPSAEYNLHISLLLVKAAIALSTLVSYKSFNPIPLSSFTRIVGV